MILGIVYIILNNADFSVQNSSMKDFNSKLIFGKNINLNYRNRYTKFIKIWAIYKTYSNETIK